MDEENDTRDQHWHVTRGIPVAVIATLSIMFISQLIGAAWFAATTISRVDAVEHAQVQMAPQGERLTRVEEKLVAVQTGIADIKSILQSPGKPGR